MILLKTYKKSDMKKETKYKVGQIIEYSFTEILDYRKVEILFIIERQATFRGVTGWWPLDEKYIKPANFKPGKLIKTCNLMGELIYC